MSYSINKRVSGKFTVEQFLSLKDRDSQGEGGFGEYVKEISVQEAN